MSVLFAVACGGEPPAGDTRLGVFLPSTPGWEFFGPAQGGPQHVYGVSQDGAGNIWIAGGGEGLFVLAPGAATLRRFTIADGLYSYTDATGAHGYKAISVAGGPGSTAFVGYLGNPLAEYCNSAPCATQPDYVVKSGDADKVVLGPAGIQVSHIDISTPPGTYPQYPQGREKIHDVFRIVYDKNRNNVWFGGNHGIALWEDQRRIWEHQHAAINGYTASGHYTMLSGDWFGLALDPSGDAWMGGGHRLAELRYASEGGGFWSIMNPIVDVWPDAVPQDAYSWQRTDDYIQALAVSGGNVWVGSIPNGLAEVTSSGTQFIPSSSLAEPRVTALQVDPKDGSLWVGHIWIGITRIKDGQFLKYSGDVFGWNLVSTDVPDIQAGTLDGQRVILVAFKSGAIGIYRGD
jgi:hypothetical protein